MLSRNALLGLWGDADAALDPQRVLPMSALLDSGHSLKDVYPATDALEIAVLIHAHGGPKLHIDRPLNQQCSPDLPDGEHPPTALDDPFHPQI